MEKNNYNFYEDYILKLGEGFKFFQDEMIEIYNKKKENIDIELIEKQLKIIKKTIKHSLSYRENFLNKIKPEIKRKVKFANKGELYNYLYDNGKQISFKTKKYLNFLQENKDKVKYFNDYINIFIIILFEIEKILNKQINFIKRNNFLENNEKGKIQKIIMGTKQKFNKKVYGDYKELLEKEEELLSAFFEIFKNKDIEKIDDLEELIDGYKKIVFYLLGGATLTVIPETPVTDIVSVLPYGLAGKEFKKIKNNPLKGTKYKSKN